MKKYAYILLLLCMPGSLLFSQQYASLWVDNPHAGGSALATIEEATLTVTPRGTYCINDLYLTFSARGSQFQPSDTLEVRMYFTMPSHTFVNDLWLWSGSDTLRALLADVSAAQSTYENIVGQRRDPALLTLVSSNYYQLSIYPMKGNETRKVKIRYITPIVPAPDRVGIEVPIWILGASYQPVSAFAIRVVDDSTWNTPAIGEDRSIRFDPVSDPAAPPSHQAVIGSTRLRELPTLSILLNGTLFNRNVYLETYTEAPDSRFFNLALRPAPLLQIPLNKKLLFLIDYDSTTIYPQSYTKASRLDDLRDALLSGYIENDSFSVIFSAKRNPHRISPSWLGLDPASIAASLDSTTILASTLDTVDLAGLLFDGVKFINENGGGGDIILYASSNKLSSESDAQRILDSLAKVMNTSTRVHIIDDNYYGAYYNNNRYFYTQLADKTNGTYITASHYSMANQLPSVIKNSRGMLELFDLSTSLLGGFTYDKVEDQSETHSLADPVTSTGKYAGLPPFLIDFGGMYDNELRYRNLSLDRPSIVESDSSVAFLWGGKRIESLMGTYQTTDTYLVKLLVDLSMRYRILTYYTAFIALEPGVPLCDTCAPIYRGPVITGMRNNEGVPTSYEILRAYPNPFNPSTTLRIRLPQGVSNTSTILIIYNIVGQKVKQLDVSSLVSSNPVDVVWDGRAQNGSTAPSGIYFAVLTTPKGKFSLKLLLIK